MLGGVLAHYRGCLENEENGENEENEEKRKKRKTRKTRKTRNTRKIQCWGGGVPCSLQLLYLMAYQLYPRYLVYTSTYLGYDLLSWTTLLCVDIGNSYLIHRYHEANSNLRYHLLL